MSDKNDDIKSMDYETTMSALQEVITKLEEQEQTLESSLSLFEEGQMLIKRCSELLDKAELKVQTLLSGQNANSGLVKE
jgi:exodeoxyribonuclease VII small subunit